MVNSQVSEDGSTGLQSAGVPGTQSNGPRMPVKPVQASSGVTRRTENVAYDTTRTVRHVKVPQGAVKRISASVLLDQAVEWKGSGKGRKRILVPIPVDQMNAIRDLVSGALGLVKDRDQLVLESLPFEQTVAYTDDAPSPAAPATPQSILSDRRVTIGGGAGIAVLLAAFALLALKQRRKSAQAEMPRALAQATGPHGSSADATKLPAQEQPLEMKHQLPPVGTKVEIIRDNLRENVKRDPVAAANVLRGWIEEDNTRGRERRA